MTEEQMQKYEYCKEYLESISKWKESLPFGNQEYGCGSTSPEIEHDLENIHENMFKKVVEALDDADNKVKEILTSI